MTDYWSEQVVLVTGGSGDVGRELATRFARLGSKVAVGFRQNRARAEEFLKNLDSPRARIYQADVSVREEVDRMISAVEQDFGPVSVLINNAGEITSNLLLTMTDEEWDRIVGSHLNGTFFCTRRVLGGMLKRKAGRIINVSSIAALQGEAGRVHYSSAKAAVIAFARSLAEEVGRSGVTCNAVVLGLIDTPGARMRVPEEVFRRIVEKSPLKRAGQTNEVADAVEFLASGKSTLMTGQVLQL